MSNQLKFRELKYFIAVAEELSFRRAAERLFITQPPLSRQIKLLEDKLGARLFERDRQGVRLTEAGNGFLEDARSLVRESEQVLDRFKPQGNDTKTTVTLGITTVIDISLFAWVEDAFKKRFPGKRVIVKRQISSQSIRDVKRGLIDVAVIGLPSFTQDLKVEYLCDDPMVACLASNHPAAEMRPLSLMDLQNDKLFWFNRKLNPAYNDHCERVFKRLGFSPQRLPEPTDHHVLLGLVSAGQGIGLMPKSLNSITRKGVVFKDFVEGDQLCIRVGVTYQAAEASVSVFELIEILKDKFSGPQMV